MPAFNALLQDLLRDGRSALRLFGHARAYALTITLTLSVAIATVVSICSFLNALLYSPLPFPDPEGLVAVGQERPTEATVHSRVSPPLADALIREARAYERVALYRRVDGLFVVGERSRRVVVVETDSALGRVLGIRPDLGRWPTGEEFNRGEPVVVISDRLWNAGFERDPAVIGKQVSLLNRSYTVVGVVANRFRFPAVTDAFVPFQETPGPSDTTQLSVVARIRPGVTRIAANTELQTIAGGLAKGTFSTGERVVFRDEPLNRRISGAVPSATAFLLASALLLFVACANVANLALSRAAERSTELSVRMALGAPRSRLMRQLLTENAVLAGVGALVGAVLALAVVRVILSVVPTESLPFWITIAFDRRILAVTVVAAVVATALIGILPALYGSRTPLDATLRGGAHTITGSRQLQRRFRMSIALQVCVAAVLTVTSGLLLRSYQQLQQTDVGYAAASIGRVGVGLQWNDRRPIEAVQLLLEELRSQLAALPGAKVVALRGHFDNWRLIGPSTQATSSGRAATPMRLTADGDTTNLLSLRPVPRQFAVSREYFRALDLNVVRGRLFADEDQKGTDPVVIVSRQFASLVWPNVDPLGRSLQTGSPTRPYTVIGVVDDVRDLAPSASGVHASARPDVYHLSDQTAATQLEMLMVADGDPMALVGRALRLVQQKDPSLLIQPGSTMAVEAGERVFMARLVGGVLGGFAIATALLVVVGVYGIARHGVAQRAREIGIRLALGSSRTAVVTMMLSEVFRVVLPALFVGLGLAALIAHAIRSLLVEIGPLDAATYVAAAIMVPAFALLGGLGPVRRAAGVSPTVAIRGQ